MSERLIIGCGYIGKQVAAAELAQGRTVQGLVRSAESVALLTAEQIPALQWDLDTDSDARPVLATRDSVMYYFIAPPPAGIEDTRMSRFLAQMTPYALPRRIVLISTTGVYGDCHGDWVNEQTPARPQAERARRRLHAEQALAAWADEHAVSYVILRVPGIYGPGKLPQARLQRGEPVLREQESPYSNRVHAHDLVRACLAAADHRQPLSLYNISDGHPSTMTDYFKRVADVLGLPQPPEISLEQARAQLSPGMLSYLAESKRLDNRLMREHLGAEPDYPDLASGLPACV